MNKGEKVNKGLQNSFIRQFFGEWKCGTTVIKERAEISNTQGKNYIRTDFTYMFTYFIEFAPVKIIHHSRTKSRMLTIVQRTKCQALAASLLL